MTETPPRGCRFAAALVLSTACALLLALPPSGRADANLAFSPQPVVFAKTTAGSEAQAQMVDVQNVGGSGVATESVAIEGPDGSDFKLSGSDCGWLEPSQHCSVWVGFAPGGAGAKTASLVVGLKEGPVESVALEGEGVPVQLAFEPGGHDFGVQRVNRGEASVGVALRNAGEGAVQLGGTGIGGADPHNFWTGGDCWGGRWLAPGESCTVQVTFNPWDTVPYSAQLEAYAHGSTFTAPLSGHGGRALLEAVAGPVEFGAVAVGSPGPVRPIVLTNDGNMSTSLFIAAIAGGSIGSFQVVEEDCTGLPIEPGASCTVEVRFAPQGVGSKHARLALFGDDDGGTMVMLDGEGLPAVPPAAPLPGPSAAPSVALPAAPAAAPAAASTRFRPGRKRRPVHGATLSAASARCHADWRCRKSRVRAARPASARR